MRLLLLLLLSFSATVAQDLNYRQAEIFFSDGTSKEGYGLIGQNKLFFKKNKEDKNKKSIKYKYKGIDSIQLTIGKVVTNYQFKKAKRTVYLMEVVESGRATLYKKFVSVVTRGFNNSYDSYETTMYFIGKKGSVEVTRVFTENAAIDKSFRKTMNTLFKNCPVLVEKIENKEYKKKNVREAVRYFNKNCSF